MDKCNKQKKREESSKMGRQRNNPKSKLKAESPERLLNKIEATKLSDIKFKILARESKMVEE